MSLEAEVVALGSFHNESLDSEVMMLESEFLGSSSFHNCSSTICLVGVLRDKDNETFRQYIVNSMKVNA